MEFRLSDCAVSAIRAAVGTPAPDDTPARVRRCLTSDDVTGAGCDVTLCLEDVRWLQPRLCATGLSVAELLDMGRMELPVPQSEPRDPQLEARCQRLRDQQANEAYSQMVRNVDSRSVQQPSLDIGKQLREVNAQLVEIFQLLFSVLAGFLFGYMASAVLSSADTSRRILCGLAVALVVLVAEAYFLVRYLTTMEHPPPASLQDLVLKKKQKELQQEREALVRRAKAREMAAQLTGSVEDKKRQ